MNFSFDIKQPDRIQVHPTNKCNLNCKFCDRDESDFDVSEISQERWEEIFEEIKVLSPERLIVSGGGEPLLRQEVFKSALRTLEDTDIKTSLVTNGILLSEDIVESMISYGWDHVLFSLHAPFAGLSDFLRGVRGSFSKTLENIGVLKEKKSELGSELPTTAVTTVINEYNYEYLSELKEMATSLDLEPLSLRILQGEHDECSLPKGEELKKLVEKLRVISSETSVKLDFNFAELEENHGKSSDRDTSDSSPFCLLPFFDMTVLANGVVSPCCLSSPENFNEFREDISDRSLIEIWRGEKFSRMRKRLLLNKPREICQRCTLSKKERLSQKAEFEDLYPKL